jgi:hypothetical protein
MEFPQFTIFIGTWRTDECIYTILSLYFSILKLEHQNIVLGADEVQGFNLRNVSKFWDEIHSGLVSLSNQFCSS